MSLIMRRFAELFLINVVLSAAITFICVNKIVPNTRVWCAVLLIIAALAYVIVNFRMLRNCFVDIYNKKWYYFGNYAAYILFASINLLTLRYGHSELYTYLFAITKFAAFLFENVNKNLSAVIFHVIMLGVIALAPLGMDWVFMLGQEGSDDV